MKNDKEMKLILTIDYKKYWNINRIFSNPNIHFIVSIGGRGIGKTTIARIIINQSKCPCCSFSCCTASISEIRVVAEKAEKDFRSTGFPSILFLDEIHRFNRKQQDFFLPFVEKGVIVLIGATTENPSFSINEVYCYVNYIRYRLYYQDVVLLY